MLLGMGWITYYLMGMLPLAWHGMAWAFFFSTELGYITSCCMVGYW